MPETNKLLSNAPPETPYDRQREHASHALAALERLRRANREYVYPSTSELQQEGLFGLRPPNRLNDLARGKYNGVRYDIEKINCGHGIFRWRLHEPARPGYPKNKEQSVIPWNERPRVVTDRQGRPLDAAVTESELPLWAVRRQ
jgi:hypothetical protein